MIVIGADAPDAVQALRQRLSEEAASAASLAALFMSAPAAAPSQPSVPYKRGGPSLSVRRAAAAKNSKIDATELAKHAADGWTMRMVAEKYGTTRQAVSQLAMRYRLSGEFKSNRSEAQATKRKNKPPTASEIKYGMPMREVERHRKSGATRAYTYQRRNADDRGIAWLFTFATWWKVWEDSGKWDQRGRGASGYVMGRIGDVGPYSPENVYICTNERNASDAWKNKPDRMRPRPVPDADKLLLA